MTLHEAAREALSLVAVILAVPGAIAVTLPEWSTLAIAGLLDVHVTPRIVAFDGLTVVDN